MTRKLITTLLCLVLAMALPLAAGTHHVALTYETPGLRTGAIVSLAALAVLLVWTFAARRVRRKK